MPAPLAIDWDRAKDLHIKGLSLAETARELGCSYAALRARAWREDWQAGAPAVSQALQRAVTDGLRDPGKEWSQRVASVLDQYMSQLETLEPGSLELDQLETAAKILERLDIIGRRIFRLDEVPASGSRAGWRGVIDVPCFVNRRAALTQAVETAKSMQRSATSTLAVCQQSLA